MDRIEWLVDVYMRAVYVFTGIVCLLLLPLSVEIGAIDAIVSFGSIGFVFIFVVVVKIRGNYVRTIETNAPRRTKPTGKTYSSRIKRGGAASVSGNAGDVGWRTASHN